jgi:hypothetical protein
MQNATRLTSLQAGYHSDPYANSSAPQGYGADPYGNPYGGGAPAPIAPAHDSDAESLREAQAAYAEAIEAAADSDASSSELEDLQEVRRKQNFPPCF